MHAAIFSADMCMNSTPSIFYFFVTCCQSQMPTRVRSMSITSHVRKPNVPIPPIIELYPQFPYPIIIKL